MNTPDLDHSYLLSILDYCRDTGDFTWKVNRQSHSAKVRPGAKAGTLHKHGYLIIGIDRKRFPAHRLAWFYVNEAWPERGMEIDHINMIPLDNRISNLRLATKALNRANQKVRRDSISGVKGVNFDYRAGKWRARCKKRTLGLFATVEEASAAYAAAASDVFGEYARP